jgi:hypothetical protein
MNNLPPRQENSEVGASVAPASAASPSPHEQAAAGKLSPEREKLAAELLIAGDTFEDVVEALNATAGPKVSQSAVEHFFRTQPAVQKGRVQRMVEDLAALKASLHTNPNSAEGKLAEAALFTGLMRLWRGGAELTVKDAVSLRMQRENLRLRQRVLLMKERDAILKRDLTRARAQHEFEKLKLTRERLRQLRHCLKGLKEGQRLEPAALQKIREIYGILNEPYTPPQSAGEEGKATAL